MANDKNTLILRNEKGEELVAPIKIWKNQTIDVIAETCLTECTIESSNEAVRAELLSSMIGEENSTFLHIKLTGLDICENVSIKIRGTYTSSETVEVTE